jgi:MipA family protein
MRYRRRNAVKTQRWAIGTLLALQIVQARPALADARLPLWELGLGAGAVSFPAYRGSDRQRSYVFPAPYLIYRGDVLRADREGLRGVFLDAGRLEVNVSVAASLPVDSSDDSVRRGMPDLRPTVEIGPSFVVNLWRSADRRTSTDLRMPVRAAFTLDARLSHVGTVFAPSVHVDVEDPFAHRDWRLGVLAGPIFADARYHGYYYDVDAAHALADRPVHRSGGGYGGARIAASASKRFERFWVGGFVRYDDLRAAVFLDSPLVKRRNAWAAGVGLSWIFAKSATAAPRSD